MTLVNDPGITELLKRHSINQEKLEKFMVDLRSEELIILVTNFAASQSLILNTIFSRLETMEALRKAKGDKL